MTSKLTGTKLVEAMAREVMGWTEWVDGAPFTGYPLFHIDEDHMGHKLIDWAIEVLDTPDKSWRIWNPLADKNDMWEVVEKLLELTPNGDFHLQHLNHHGWGICTCLNKEEGGLWTGWVYADTVPTAILQAALMAVRGGVV